MRPVTGQAAQSSCLPPNRRGHAAPTRSLRKPQTTQRARSNPIVRSRWPIDAQVSVSALASLARESHEIGHVKARQLLGILISASLPAALFFRTLERPALGKTTPSPLPLLANLRLDAPMIETWFDANSDRSRKFLLFPD